MCEGSLKDMEIAFSIRQTSFPRCFVYVFVLHYICVVVGFADQLLVSLGIGGMDSRYHQVIYPGYHHVQTVQYATIVEYSGIMYATWPTCDNVFKMSKFGPQTACTFIEKYPFRFLNSSAFFIYFYFFHFHLRARYFYVCTVNCTHNNWECTNSPEIKFELIQNITFKKCYVIVP